ncbi:MAG TPA: hypothetical protein VGG33_12450 [Polyangia bacterium]
MNQLKMKIVFGSSGKKASGERKPPEEDTLSAMRPAVLPPGLLRHTTAAIDAQESLRLLARQRKAQIRNRRLKRAAWVMSAAALGWWGIFSDRTPEPAVASTAQVAEAAKPTAPAASAPRAPAAPGAPTTPTAALPVAPAPVAAVPPSQATAAVARSAGFLEGAGKVVPAAGVVQEPAARCEEDFSHGRWRAAIESCGLAFDTQPGAALALKIAHAHWSSGKVERAGTWARKAVELGTDDADAFVLIGHSERQSGDLAGAMTAYRRYLRWSPRGWHARDVRAALRDLKAKAALEADVAAVAAPSPS